MVKGARKRRCAMTSTAPDSGAWGVMSRCEAALVLSFLCVLPHRLDRFTGEDRQSIPKAFPVKHGKTLPNPPSHSPKFRRRSSSRESAHFSGDRCTHPADLLYRRQMPRAPDPHAEFFRTDFLIKRSDMSTWLYYTPFFT